MSECLLLLISVCAVYLLSRRDVLSPATVYCAVTAGTAWMFYVAAVRRMYPQSLAHWWMFKYDYRDVSATVLGIYLILASVAVLADVAARRSWFASGRLAIFPQSVPLTGRRINLNLRNPLRSYMYVFALTSALSLICIVHLVVFGLASIWEYKGYLATRDPLWIGIDNPALQLFHRALPEIGTVLCMVMASCYARGRMSVVWLLLFPTIYAVAFTASLCTRFIAVQFASAGLILFLSGRRHRPTAVLCCMAALISYGAVLALRQSAGNYGDYGLQSMFITFLNGNIMREDSIFFTFFNCFQGSFNLGHAVLHAPLDYPLEYKLKSFFPTPSFIDGFQSVRAIAQLKANSNAPYGAYAETYLFGAGWFAAYTAFIFWSLATLTRFWRRNRGIGAAFVVCFSYLCFFLTHTYPVRNSFRLILLTVIVATIFGWYKQASVPVRFASSGQVHNSST